MRRSVAYPVPLVVASTDDFWTPAPLPAGSASFRGSSKTWHTRRSTALCRGITPASKFCKCAYEQPAAAATAARVKPADSRASRR